MGLRLPLVGGPILLALPRLACCLLGLAVFGSGAVCVGSAVFCGSGARSCDGLCCMDALPRPFGLALRSLPE
eukprot:12891431-Heterocapsa_arctica.AAC.1